MAGIVAIKTNRFGVSRQPLIKEVLWGCYTIPLS